ncbi:hypothetical protein [Polaromonas sp.]|uniref:hypothetical protein n=1 Tax=Polaromonas sp. TaxID=1869339 RepID=UPI002D773E3F|nr:hypothetical protein [Polaromonas sp.]
MNSQTAAKEDAMEEFKMSRCFFNGTTSKWAAPFRLVLLWIPNLRFCSQLNVLQRLSFDRLQRIFANL